MERCIKRALSIQKFAWNNGHDNHGTKLDVLATAHDILSGFKHLNKAQMELYDEISKECNLKYAKKLCSRANKSIRHFIVTLK